MNWWQALIVGVVEGLTEYLPVSSTGHILLVQRMLGIPQNDAADAYAICVQAGAILAVLGLYWKRVRQMHQGVRGRDRDGWRLLLNVSAAFIITGIIGLMLEKRIKAVLFNLPAITLAWLVGGLAILAVVFLRRARSFPGRQTGQNLEHLTLPASVAIGMSQCLAMWPGTSRSLVTIVAGLFLGLSVSAAVEFSFLLGVVTLLGASAYDLFKHHQALLQNYTLLNMLLGLVAAWISATVAIKWMVSYLRQHSLAIFGYYRVALGLVVGLLLLLKVL